MGTNFDGLDVQVFTNASGTEAQAQNRQLLLRKMQLSAEERTPLTWNAIHRSAEDWVQVCIQQSLYVKWLTKLLTLLASLLILVLFTVFRVQQQCDSYDGSNTTNFVVNDSAINR